MLRTLARRQARSIGNKAPPSQADKQLEDELLARLLKRPRGPRVMSVQDGAARVRGLDGARVGRQVEYACGLRGLVVNLEAGGRIGTVVLGDHAAVKPGSEVSVVDEPPLFPVMGTAGRVLDALGEPLDGGPALPEHREPFLDVAAPSMFHCKRVGPYLETGVRTVDVLHPLSCGQRTVLLGAPGSGKRRLALDIAAGARAADRPDSPLFVVYVLVGASKRRATAVVNELWSRGLKDHSTVIVSDEGSPPALQYLAPFAGCRVGEQIRNQGGHALVIYDTLSQHAAAYDELAGPLRRPAFADTARSLHASLLERAAAFKDDNGGGSLTALPLVTTSEAGTLRRSVDEALSSAADDHITLDSHMAAHGEYPPVNVLAAGFSTSGKRFQPRAVRSLANKLKVVLGSSRRERESMEVADKLGLLMEGDVEFAVGSYGEFLQGLFRQPELEQEPESESGSVRRVGRVDQARSVVGLVAALGGALEAAGDASRVPQLEAAMWAAAQQEPGLVEALNAAPATADLSEDLLQRVAAVVRASAREFGGYRAEQEFRVPLE